ncbi:MAG TPA: carboxypeptidase-like regulatory domain-containing protein [Candidatus Acidoferrales bacterium]|nr:carboxypeptidase-like regulatory domain-containing protein [Candidatus Acidoferrales bacterium]
MLLIALAGGLVLVVPASAQSIEAPNIKTGSILGTVVDSNNDTIPNATVVLQKPGGYPLTVVTKDDGSFAFHDVTPGIAYQITVTAEGFAEWSSSVTVEPGQEKTLTDVTLHILAVQRAVTVTYSSTEVAAQQLKAEEHQRVLGFIPNIYVTYEPHPEPLTTKMKFHLAYKGLTHPTFFAFEALWAGVEQAADTPDYRLGAKGYGERFGANLASGTSEALFGNAILPSLLHQDPRYFYRGSGTKGSRAWHAIIAPFVCQGDNGKSQPNYSQWGGSLISASLANTYYPDSNRGAGLIFRNFGTSMGLHVALGLAQEFLLDKFTSRGKH